MAIEVSLADQQEVVQHLWGKFSHAQARLAELRHTSEAALTEEQLAKVTELSDILLSGIVSHVQLHIAEAEISGEPAHPDRVLEADRHLVVDAMAALVLAQE